MIQLTTLEPTFTVPKTAIGSLLPLSNKTEGMTRTTHIQAATLASHTTSDYTGLIFTGDVMLARHVESLMNREGSQYPYARLSLPELLPGAAIIGNFESAIATEHHQTPNNTLRFSVKRDFLPGLKEAGFTHLSLANNHSLDYGETDFWKGYETFTEAGLVAFGKEDETDTTVSVTYLSTPGGVVSIIALNDSDAHLDRTKAIRTVQEAVQDSDLQFVYIHWGEEYSTSHSQAQETLAGQLVDAGADVIIGHHPHVVQDIGLIEGVPVIYSLGNYIFDQYFSPDVQTGMLVQITFTDIAKIELIPVTSQGTPSQPYLMTGDEKAEFLYTLAKSSEPEYQADIRRGFLPLYKEVASSPKMAMMNSF